MCEPRQRWYQQDTIYEASDLTTETPKHPELREGGLLYSQIYASVNNIVGRLKMQIIR